MEFLENRRSWENQKPTENRQKSELFWASPFTMHLVWTLLIKNVMISKRIRSGPANQTKERSGHELLTWGIPEQKFNVNRACFPKEKHTRIHNKMGEIHELFVLALSLVCRGDSWCNPFRPKSGPEMPEIITSHAVREPLKHALSASCDVNVSGQICGSKLQRGDSQKNGSKTLWDWVP